MLRTVRAKAVSERRVKRIRIFLTKIDETIVHDKSLSDGKKETASRTHVLEVKTNRAHDKLIRGKFRADEIGVIHNVPAE